ncbi:hypothetical protein [Bacillus suaedae]|uniref:Uncharacterized protein n=1 Tax=Halalkalibacter suaedae TaxID=2822140 RepID=A0A941AQ05_9BACI|nr:hypothetical protein [Bacillus suaedae]MBP3950653.1 hypothetical protein [Bacillus suaedae]
MKLLLEQVSSFFTPSHKKPIDEHLISDSTTRRLLEDAEDLLIRITENLPKNNQNKTITRKQPEWKIKVKIKQTMIIITLTDQKKSTAPINKRIVIRCYRKYIKADNGVGVCKEASIHYIKDGRAQIRSVKDSPLFRTLFYRIHYLDSALANDITLLQETSKAMLQQQETLLKTSDGHDILFLIEEAKRYQKLLKHFQVDPAIENRLGRILQQANQLQDDFSLLDFEERHVVRRMLREDIPSLLHTFISLTAEHQAAQIENIYMTLTKMELTLIDFNEKLEKERVSRMDYLFQLQSLRYDRNTKQKRN